MMRIETRTVLLLTFVLSGATASWPAIGAEKPPGPVAHLLAPSRIESVRNDTLATEAALRLTAAELAARYNVYVKYWPVDQLDKIPKDAYPRLELRTVGVGRLRHLRLRRRGETFIFLASKNGSKYVELGRTVMAMPSRTYVGFAIVNQDHQKTGQAVLAKPRLNGKEIAEWKQAHVGSRSKDIGIRRNGNQWTIRNVGFWTYEDQRARFPFVYTDCEGDFDMDVVFQRLSGDAEYTLAGVLCRATLDLKGPSIGVFANEKGQWGYSRRAGFGRLYCHWPSRVATVVGTLWTTSKRDEELFRLRTSWANWQKLVESTETLAEHIREGLAKKLKFRLPAAAETTPAARRHLRKLTQARKLALTANSGKILTAGRLVSEVLDASPTSPEAHYRAAMCGSILACQELYGTFHDRPRFLAGPLSHWMLARELRGPQSLEDKLDGAWLMLACGFPKEAMSVVQAVSAEERNRPEVKALRMFITRDYRPLTAETVQLVSPIEQLAWLWAAQACGRSDLLQAVPGELARQNRSFAFLPLYGHVGMGPGHCYSIEGMALACARDAFDLLTCDDIAKADRLARGKALAVAAGAYQADEIRQLARNVAWMAADRGLPDETAAVILAMMGLYQKALELPAGPTVLGTDGKIHWQVLSAHDFADLQRGMFLLALYQRANFMASMWGVSLPTHQFCQEVSKGLEGLPGASMFFKSYGLAQIHRYEEAKKLSSDLLREPFGRNMAVRCVMIKDWPDEAIMRHLRYCGRRGAWDYSNFAEATRNLDEAGYSMTVALAQMETDQYCYQPLTVLNRLTTAGAEVSQPFVESMPYHLRLLRHVAFMARSRGQEDKAVGVYRWAIALAPKSSKTYHDLAELYVSTDRLEDAVETVELARKSCESSMGLSNLFGKTAGWLVELDRPKEALDYGRLAARGYSDRGLAGLAVALAANGEKAEALDVFRTLAYRSESGTQDFTAFLLREGYPGETILQELADVLGKHAGMRGRVIDYIKDGFVIEPGHNDVLEKAFAGPLKSVSRGEQLRLLILSSMRARKLDELIAYSHQLAETKPRTAYQVVWTYLASLLAKRPQVQKELEAQLAKHRTHERIGLHVRYLLRQIDKGQLLEGFEDRHQKAYAYWILGAEAEAQGDMPAAVKAYKIAAGTNVPSQASQVPRSWLKLLRGRKKAATSPASAT